MSAVEDTAWAAGTGPGSPPGALPVQNEDQDPNQSQNPAPKKSNIRKRTKTGCLTCRKRRIKCDEGKPTCGNCIKSKRECEGYNQRIVFKESMGSFASGNLFGHPVYHHQATQEALLHAQLSAAQSKAASSQGPLAAIAPKPPSIDYSGSGIYPYPHQGLPGPSTPSTIVGMPPLQPPPIQPPSQTQYSPHNQLPSPPNFPPDPAFYPDQLSPHIHGDPRNFLNISPVSQQPLQQNVISPLEQISPVFGRHPTTLPPPEQQLASPDSMEAALSRTISGTEEEYWQSDDEASMGASDDEMMLDLHSSHLESNDLGIQVARRLGTQVDAYGTQIRSFATFVDANVLDTYMPSSENSPLNDSQTAAIFWYFVNVTGQSMSLYERHPFDPTPMFQGQPVPKQRQHIWTYTFPIMAFNHPALMQAILALGSLQMAKLQNSSPTAAMKHYHLSLRRIAKNYSSPTRRTQPATLAATLLLGFYEVWNSDHDKWCKHMWGARAILKEIPLRQMTRDILAMKRKQREQEFTNHHCSDACFASHHLPKVDIEEVDTEFIEEITGLKVDYGGGDGYVLNDGASSRASRITERDVERYEQLRDLFWWYCKMDVYQSILGGTRPFMNYKHWTQCVPRGQFGKIDSIYGTFDHLMLLLGRLAGFASRDLARKRKARKFGPPPGFGGPPGGGPPGAGPPGGPPAGNSPTGSGRGQSPPAFAGLMPSSGTFTVPRGFSPPRETTPSSDDVITDEADFNTSTSLAMREWESIRQAFDLFRSRLGPDFDPLGPDFAPPDMTPFGPALTYRTYSIAGIWMNYYMGLIVLHRAHPNMPPIAVMAAGMAAPQTGKWANEIARIAAGLHEDTTHVSAVSTLFQSLPQRHWTIRRLRDIARLTGWQSARQIADGCEAGWNKAAALGRGPPYHSPPELGPLFPDEVWNRHRRIDRRIHELGAGDKRFVLAKTEQTHYALGLLSVERDLDTLDISGDEGEGDGKEES
ncbi:transcriptional regulatory protein moc3 [Podospora australis]|uniref:Transcriptional regulatory protein moc3 n=1 Tax=Podospora australis TaxID=1536484 RepID=A0AAN6X6T5_9PEZI|nr:transcriptional regulatory protein moc3 [Podospora australis]